jgi:hypothetical protein
VCGPTSESRFLSTKSWFEINKTFCLGRAPARSIAAQNMHQVFYRPINVEQNKTGFSRFEVIENFENASEILNSLRKAVADAVEYQILNFLSFILFQFTETRCTPKFTGI